MLLRQATTDWRALFVSSRCLLASPVAESGGRVRGMLWSLVEKAFQRGVAGVLAFAIAWVLPPSEVGYYGVAVSVLTLTLMASDFPLRQMGAVVEASELPRFDRTARLFPLVTVPVNCLAILLLGSEGASTATMLGLLPLAFVPLFAGFGSTRVVRLQRKDAFREIATTQLIATMTSVAIALPVLLLTRSVLGPALQFALSEAVMMLLVRRRIALDRSERVASMAEVRRMLRSSASTMATTVTSWGQLLADRVVMLTVASPALIGSYAFGSAVARLPNDVVTLGVVTVSRPRLAAALSHPDRREWDRQTGFLFRLTGSLLFVASIGLNFLLIPLMALTLPDAWGSALAVAPLLVLGAALNALNYILQTVLIAVSAMKRAFQLQVVAALLSVPVGLSAYFGLTAVGLALVARELILAPFQLQALSPHVPRRSLLEWWLWMLGVAVVCALAMAVHVSELGG